ncbi:DUF4878 domain-containing protein [Acetonema longum]|uniref:DUF4878 domain-containing protein n=1 Tax=Acetonema longum DSM 6540 TaxID=1009370 RepID=F7NGI5_9FIRM|nr:DUF4878 domain-containing protein [Acetonema longum]EGO64789.1 hypothetical protein ALO_05865 [Acetonema longum DSM 6540]
MNKKYLILLMLAVFALSAVLGGCGGKKGERVLGLTPEGVISTAFKNAKEQNFRQAATYVSPDSLSGTKSVANLLAGMSGKEIKHTNLLSVKKVAQQGDFAAVIVTVQQEDSFKLNFQAVGLERINDEWYIVSNDQILENAKYRVLAQLLANI